MINLRMYFIYTLINIHTYFDIYANTHTQTHTHSQTHTHTHVRTHSHTHTQEIYLLNIGVFQCLLEKDIVIVVLSLEFWEHIVDGCSKLI